MFKIQKAKWKLLFTITQLTMSIGTPQLVYVSSSSANATPPRAPASMDQNLFPDAVIKNPADTAKKESIQSLIRNYNDNLGILNTEGGSAQIYDPLNGLNNGGGIFQQTNYSGYNELPSEFSCPLFESNPYESIFRALDSIQQNTQITPGCSGINSSNDPSRQIQSNSESIRQAVTQLRLMQTSPDSVQDMTPDQMNTLIQNVIGSANNISAQLSSNPLLNSQCGKATAGKTLLALNDVVNSLAPIALVVAATNPALGAATKVALMGASMIPSAISQTTAYIRNNTVDISDPEIRKSILQGTCQFMKVYQKINFLRYKEEDNLNEIQGGINRSTTAYRQKYSSPSDILLDSMSYKYQSEQKLAQLELQIAADRAQLNYFYRKIKALGDDHERICFAGQNMIQNSLDAVSFPASVNRSVEVAIDILKSNNEGASQTSIIPVGLPPSPDDPQNPAPVSAETEKLNQQMQEANELLLAVTKSRNRVAIYVEKVVQGDNVQVADQSVPLCATEVKGWLKRLTDTVNFLSKAINSERGEIDQILSQVPEYKTWNRDYLKLRSERKTVSTVTKVLREMSKPEAVYIRSELAQRANDLKNTLFNRTSGLLSKSPVEAWIKNNTDQYQNAVSQYVHFIRLLQQGVDELAAGGGTLSNHGFWGKRTMISPLAAILNPDVWNNMVTQVNLNSMNLKTLPSGSRKNEIACQQIRTGILKYNEAKDFLGSAQFMCDMIDPIVSDTNTKLVEICRGSSTFNSNVRSTLDQFKAKLVFRGQDGRRKSLQDTLNLLKAKNKELRCSQVTADFI